MKLMTAAFLAPLAAAWLAAAPPLAQAKLPPPDAAAQALADEASARAAWQAKADAFQLCKAQDRVAARLRQRGGAAAAPAAAATACADPGPFAYNLAQQKPLETSGAHSPTGTAASPPSVRDPAARMTPGAKR